MITKKCQSDNSVCNWLYKCKVNFILVNQAESCSSSFVDVVNFTSVFSCLNSIKCNHQSNRLKKRLKIFAGRRTGDENFDTELEKEKYNVMFNMKDFNGCFTTFYQNTSYQIHLN